MVRATTVFATRIRFILACCLGLLSGACQNRTPLYLATTARLGPALVAGDLSPVFEGSFPVRNSTGETLDVVEAVSSCGCLRAEIDPGPLSPGETRDVRVRYFPAPGQTSTDVVQVAVRCRNGPTIWATVHVVTFPRLEVTPRYVTLGGLLLGQSATAEVQVRVRAERGQDRPLELLTVATRQGIVNVTDSGWTGPLSSGPYSAWERKLVLTLPPTGRTGGGSDELLLTFDRDVRLSHHDQPSRTLSVYVYWNRLPLVSADPSSLMLLPGEETVVALRKHVSHRIRVVGLEFSPPVQGLEVEPQPPDVLPVQVTIRWHPPADASISPVLSLLQVRTDADLQPRLEIPIALAPKAARPPSGSASASEDDAHETPTDNP